MRATSPQRLSSARAGAFAMLVGAVAASGGLARASETGPVIVVPGRDDVPVMMDGYDISGAVVEGDWGLARPGNINPTVIYRLGPAYPLLAPPVGAYFPRMGRPPRYGRKEIETRGRVSRPPPAESYHRSWTSQSDPLPETLLPPPYDPPPVIYAPRGAGHR